MAYADDIKKKGLEWVWYVEIIPRMCSETYGSFPCTASGGQCAYSWATCEDQENFALTTPFPNPPTFKFSSKMGPHIFKGQAVQPTLLSVSDLPTELEQKNFTTINARMILTFEDVKNPPPFSPEKGTGKYYAYGVSTFWRIFARVFRESYKYCKVKVYEGISEYTTLGEFKLKRELLLSNIEFDAHGKVRITATDKTRQAKAINIPNTISSTNVLTGIMDIYSSLVPVTDSDEFKILDGGYTSYGKIIDSTNGDEYFSFSGIDSIGNLEIDSRGLFGTTAVAHAAGCEVIQVAPFCDDTDTGIDSDSGQNPVDSIKQILIGWLGIASADVDTTQFDSEKNIWYNSRRFRRIVETPIQASKLIDQINKLLLSNVWQNDEQKLTFKGFHPNPFGVAASVFSNDDNIVENSLGTDNQIEEQISRVLIHYKPTDTWGIKDHSEKEDFYETLIWLNASAENPNGQGDIAEKEFYADWIWKEEDARRFASRFIKRYSPTAPKEIVFTITRKDADVVTGDLVDFESDRFVDDDGSIDTLNFQILRKTESQIGVIQMKALETKFELKYGFIAPTAWPDWGAATTDEKKYAYICEVTSDGTPQMTDGSEATYIW